MLLQSAVAVKALSATLAGGKNNDSLTTVQQLGLFASALHGLWMAGFLLARDTLLETYRHKKVALDKKTARLTLGNRLVMWLGVSALYLALFVPTWSLASATTTAGVSTSCAATSEKISTAGVAVSLLGLWLEVTADLVKAFDKRRDPGGFSRGCVYRLCRQPNLLGEALFWWGTAAAGAPALVVAAKGGAGGAGGGGARAAAVALAAAAAGGVAAITAILVGDSRKKTKDQEARMRGKGGWREYAARTPPLWPMPRRA